MSVFNLNNTKSHLDRNCFFDEPVDIARYDKVKYPQIEKLTEKQWGFFWRPQEVELSRDSKDFKTLEDHEKHIFTSNLKRQILLDSVQGRAPSLAFSPICSLPELETWIATWTFFETIHSKSYTHIIRNLYPDPSVIFDEILDLQEIVDCSKDISKYYDQLISQINGWDILVNDIRSVCGIDPTEELARLNYERKKSLWLCLNAVNFLEGIRFYASFACSWNFAELKKMEGNAKIIKFIARDENIHLAVIQQVLRILPREDPEFITIREECTPSVIDMVKSVVAQEHGWTKYLFKYGSMIGLNETMLCDFVDERADRCLKVLGYPAQFGNKKKTLPWTDKWIAGSDVQVAPQEVTISSYVVGGVKNDIDEETFKGFKL